MRRLRCLVVLSVAALIFPTRALTQTPPTEPPREAPTSPAVPTTPPPTESPSTPATPPPPPPLGSTDALPAMGPSHAEKRIEELERRLHALEEKHAAPRDPAPDKSTERSADKKGSQGVAVAHGNDGVGIASADGKFQLRFRPLVQADARFFVNDGTNTFLLRRVRPTLEGTVYEFFDWHISPGLANTPTLFDAFANVRLFREIQLRAGKFKPPVGLERLTNASDLPFLERGLPTNLVPNRDIGVQLHGDVLGGTVVYAAGIFNGAGDGVNGNRDNNDKKDVVGRIMIRPFQPTFIGPLRNLGLGIAATRGTHAGTLPSYVTPVGTTFFQYADGVTAGGTFRRIAPQMVFYVGPFGMFAEYTRSTQHVVAPGVSARLNHAAWQVVGSFFITGEEASPNAVTPKRQLDPRRGGYGAVEVVARFGELKIDGDAFRLGVANATVSAQKATDWGLGINWHLARNFKGMLDYEHTSFDGGATMGDRTTEIVVLTRLQAAY